jgi:GTP pyrophosphokinase
MAVVERVLPWRRQPVAAEALAPVIATFRSHHPKGDASVITRAFEMAESAHTGQTRKSGEAYIHHPIAVSQILADLGLDEVTIASGLLHDAVEDTNITLVDVEREFGAVVAACVDGVTKLERLHFDSREAQQAATMRKMLLAMARDWRVLLVKLADRLHNLRTIAALREDKQKRIAKETLDIYAPLAHRLGIQEVKWQLEDLSFASLYPRRYAEIEYMVATRAPAREQFIDEVIVQVRECLEELRIQGTVSGRPKHLWSIYEKMVDGAKEFDEIFDLVGVRVTVDSVKDCYAALGSIHARWRPLPGRFKDYIAMPKFNLYQSLHTTVVGPGGKTLEVQIRTAEMHARAEFGIAAHWGYKENASANEVAWLQRLVDMQSETADPSAFLDSFKLEIDQEEVFVFTPKGRVITLSAGATPIDFAYTVHTDVGHKCIGAKINGRLAPLDSKLVSGDTVEIFTSKVPTAGPSRDWLQIAASPRARAKIKAWFSKERREDAIDQGREDLIKSLRKEGLPNQQIMSNDTLPKLAAAMNYADVDSLLVGIGEGHVSAQSLAQRIAKDLRADDDEGSDESVPTFSPRPARKRSSSAGVVVEGLDDILVRLSRCCNPVPGDAIVGFVTRGRGVSVHRDDCANAEHLAETEEGRVIDVAWDRERSGSFIASIEIKALDRTKLLTDVARVLSDYHVSIISSSTVTGSDRISRMRFEFELADPGHLDSILSAVKRVDSVYDAYRMVPNRA